MQRTLRAARAAGLLDGDDFGSSHLTDRGVTTIEIHANHQRRMISVRAGLGPAGDRGLTSRERQAQRAVRRFVHLALEPRSLAEPTKATPAPDLRSARPRASGRGGVAAARTPGPRRRKATRMQEHSFTVDLDAPRDEVWEMFWYRAPDRPQPRDVRTRIEILHPGDDIGEGLVRHCWFPVPRFLLSGGVGQSWEWLTEVRPIESWRYDAIGKPLWSRATGHTRLEDLGEARTRVHFHETYETFNPLMRRVGLERYVHRRLSRDNDTILAALEGGLRWHRARHRGADQST